MNRPLLGIAWWACICVFVALVVIEAGGPARAQDPPCSESVGLWGSSTTCVWTFPEYQAYEASEPAHYVYVVVQPDNGGIQKDDLICGRDGDQGVWHDVFVDGVDVGDVCVPDDAVKAVDIAALVTRQFKRYEWPASQLVVQPPGQKTLVNFETNFFTRDILPITKSVTIAGREVQIRATQATYIFIFGDGTSTRSSSPGRPNPDLDITHIYTRAAPVKVRLDTIYSGEFRTGNGDWRPIDATVTVQGGEQGLAVVEAMPQLVIR